MKYFTTDIEADVHDMDFNGIAKASALMRYIQSTAQSQLTANGYSYDELKEMKRAFILSRIKLEFTENVYAYDKLSAGTFPCTSHGFTFLRCYKLEKEGRIIGRGISAWALVDTERHSLVKVNDFDLGLKTYTPIDMPLSRIMIPKDIEKVGEYRVNYADLDQNKHMNNTKYPDMLSNYLPLDKKRIETITLSYMNEATFGELLSVERAYRDGVYYIRTTKPSGKVNCEAEITLTDI